MQGAIGAIKSRVHIDNHFLVLMVVICLAITATTLCFPAPALAAWKIEDPIGSLVSELFKPLLTAMGEASGSVADESMKSHEITKELQNILSGIYPIATTIAKTAIQPIAYMILAVTFALRFLDITKLTESDGGGFPIVERVGYMLVTFILCKFAIDNAPGIVTGIFNLLSHGAIAKATDPAEAHFATIFTTMCSNLPDTMSIADAFILFICVGLVSLTGFLMSCIVKFLIYGRAIQLYVYLVCSPIPLAMLANNETKSIGVSFLKNVLSVSFSFFILFVIMSFAPGLVSSLMPDTHAFMPDAGGAIAYTIPVLVLCGLLILSLVKSQAWAKEIFAG